VYVQKRLIFILGEGLSVSATSISAIEIPCFPSPRPKAAIPHPPPCPPSLQQQSRDKFPDISYTPPPPYTYNAALAPAPPTIAPGLIASTPPSRALISRSCSTIACSSVYASAKGTSTTSAEVLIT